MSLQKKGMGMKFGEMNPNTFDGVATNPGQRNQMLRAIRERQLANMKVPFGNWSRERMMAGQGFDRGAQSGEGSAPGNQNNVNTFPGFEPMKPFTPFPQMKPLPPMPDLGGQQMKRRCRKFESNALRNIDANMVSFRTNPITLNEHAHIFQLVFTNIWRMALIIRLFGRIS